MGIFSGSKDKRELALVFDVGSSSVGGAVFEIQKKGSPKVILSFREPIAMESEFNINKFLSLTIKTLENIASKISKAGVGEIKKISCVLSSPWYASQIRVIKYEKNVSFVFTEKLAEELTKKEINLFEEEHLAQFSNSKDKVRPIEFKNIKLMLNGYPSAEPHNKKAKKLEMVVFISMSGEKILKLIEDTIFKHFHSRDVSFSSFLMASFTVVRDLFKEKDNFLLVDIGGEVTDISMIKKDVLNNSISYPLGRNFMIRNLAKSLDCTLSEAKSLIFLYKDGHAGEATEKKLEPVISKLKEQWLKGFQESLVNLSNDISIPANIFVTVDRELVGFFSKIIKMEQFSQYTLAESKFHVTFLDSKALYGHAFLKDGMNHDPFLIIESIYINNFIC